MATLFDKPKQPRKKSEKRPEQPWCPGCRRDHSSYDLCPECLARWDAEDAAATVDGPKEGPGPRDQSSRMDAPARFLALQHRRIADITCKGVLDET